MSDEVNVMSDEKVELFLCQRCGEEKPAGTFKKGRWGLTRTCKACFGAMVTETRGREANEIDAEDDDPEGVLLDADRTTAVLADLLDTIGKALVTAAHRLRK